MLYFYQLEEKQVCKDFIFENGLVCSFASLFSNDPSSIFIQAMEDTQIVEMNYNDVLQLYEDFRSGRNWDVSLFRKTLFGLRDGRLHY